MKNLSRHIDNFANTKVLCIGDIMLDIFDYGKVNRISPEAPVPIFKLIMEKQMLGGAGNVAANLSALGAKATFLGIVGNDKEGVKLTYLLREMNVKSSLLKLDDYSTIVKRRMIADHNHLLRIDQEENLPLVKSLLPRYESILNKAIKNADIVLMSDYNKGILSPQSCQIIINICNKYDKKTIIDPKGNDYKKYTEAYLLKPNLNEFCEASSIKTKPSDKDFYYKLKEGAKKFFEDYKIQNILVTLSEFGMAYISSKKPEDILHIPTEAKEVFDVSGAGDTSLATLGVAIGSDSSIKDAIKLANIASGLVVAKLGTSTISADELKEAIVSKQSQNNAWMQKRKIISLNQAQNILSKLKESNKTIGFTNGCFDCLHLGHLHSFMEARKLCDILVVAINSDDSVRRYKGENRPIQDENTRAILLASLEFVDYVIVFNEDTALDVIDAIRPDVIAKEGYSIDKWAEAQFVQSYGGKVVTLKRLEGYSTSKLVNKIKG